MIITLKKQEREFTSIVAFDVLIKGLVSNYKIVKSTGMWTILGKEVRIETNTKPEMKAKLKNLVLADVLAAKEALKKQTKKKEKLKLARRKGA